MSLSNQGLHWHLHTYSDIIMGRISDNNTTAINGRKFSKFKSEESGYDSDTTRNGSSSSPRGSVKSDSYDPSDSYDSSTSDKGDASTIRI